MYTASGNAKSMLPAAVHFCGSFSFGMDLNMLVASWLGLITVPVDASMLVLNIFAITLSLACWGDFLATWEVEEEKADIYVW